MAKLPNNYVKCPKCGKTLNSATSVDDPNAIPKEGDLSVCFGCGTLLEYEEGWFVHELPAETLEKLKRNEPESYASLMNLREYIVRMIHHKN